ncbi:MAG: DeoR/GlpR family DNA-binding transcription regulator [Anaerolineae bacterium]
MAISDTTNGAERVAAKDRRSQIALEVQQRGWVSVAELSRRFEVSAVSIRSDLAHLEAAGMLARVRGGAQSLPDGGHISNYDLRVFQNLEAKRAIGTAAAALIQPNSIIFLDAGTTVLEVVRAIPTALLGSGSLTVVTRSVRIANELRNHRRTRLILLGGVYVHDFDDFVGDLVEHALSGMRVDKLFIGTDGLSLTRGITTDNVLEVGLYRQMAHCADEVVVVADSTKIGHDQFQAILSFEEIDTLITDSGAPQPFIEALRNQGLAVVVVPTT